MHSKLYRTGAGAVAGVGTGSLSKGNQEAQGRRGGPPPRRPLASSMDNGGIP